MIKHTPHDHPDHGSLQLALGEIKTLADRMNRGEKEVDQAEREAERLRDLEATIEGMTEVSYVVFVAVLTQTTVEILKLCVPALVLSSRKNISGVSCCEIFFNTRRDISYLQVAM